ncbi:MAG TPA: hypothetical protein PLL32_06960 [Anaeromyxobacteraceae bacterium]|nr:hypothetical protein [Anaeromyxobacteraceae bacterium]
MGTAGGTVTHSSGVKVQIPAGALSGNTTVTVQEVALPHALPAGVTAVGPVYEVSLGSATLQRAATLEFPFPISTAQPAPGSHRFYRWDGELWTSAGGTPRGDAFSTGTRSFSAWVLGTGPSLHKPFDFLNDCCYDASVYVDRYFLRHPDLDAPINPSWGFPVPVNAVPRPRAVFPQGCYSFCAEWVIPPTSSNPLPSLRHAVIGGVPPEGNWNYCLDENSNDLVPETVLFSTSVSARLDGPGGSRTGAVVEGPCPAAQAVGSGGGVPVGLAGTWSLLLRCSGQANPAMTLTFTVAQQGGGFTGAGTGTDYSGIPLSGTLQGAYYASTGTISGTISISSSNILVRTDVFSAPLVSDTGYVRFTVTSHTGYEGCVIEGRFVKQ